MYAFWAGAFPFGAFVLQAVWGLPLFVGVGMLALGFLFLLCSLTTIEVR